MMQCLTQLNRGHLRLAGIFAKVSNKLPGFLNSDYADHQMVVNLQGASDLEEIKRL